MKTTKQFFPALIITLLILLSGCSTPVVTPDLEATIAANVAIAQTSAAIQTSTALAEITVTTTVPTETPTLEASPTAQFTPTPKNVMLTLTRDTYCRKGVTSDSALVSLLTAGQTVEVLAKNPTSDSYYVVDPLHTNSRCWLWGYFSTVNGDQTILPVYTSQPITTPTNTPIPQTDFSISYVNITNCAPSYTINLFVKNTSKVTWQTIQIALTDATTKLTTTNTNTSFVEYAGCAAGLSQSDLVTGEGSNVAGTVASDPTGHEITASITLCQTDSYGGCITKSIVFTP